jgi:hypothetical protein
MGCRGIIKELLLLVEGVGYSRGVAVAAPVTTATMTGGSRGTRAFVECGRRWRAG